MDTLQRVGVRPVCRPGWSLVLAVLVLVLFVDVPLGRTQEYPVAEGYVGVTVFNNEYGTDRHNSPGVVFNFGYNPTRYPRLVADVGAEMHNTNIVWTNGRSAKANDYQLLFGPELAIRAPKVTPFVHGLVGVAFRNYAVPNGNWICTGYTCYEDSFSIAKEYGFASSYQSVQRFVRERRARGDAGTDRISIRGAPNENCLTMSRTGEMDIHLSPCLKSKRGFRVRKAVRIREEPCIAILCQF